jgi:hypothetical protein
LYAPDLKAFHQLPADVAEQCDVFPRPKTY